MYSALGRMQEFFGMHACCAVVCGMATGLFIRFGIGTVNVWEEGW